MQEIEINFIENIYKYCDDNIGEEVLFTRFMHLWPQLKQEINKKNLVVLTSGILNDIIKRKIIIEISKNFENPYAMYRILPHEKLIENKGYNNL